MSKFQLALLIAFGILIVGGVIIFAAYRGSSTNVPTVTVWGSIPTTDFSTYLTQVGLSDGKLYKVNYVEKSEEEFDAEFIEALASGAGPDLFMLPSDKILTHRNKIYPIPYTVFTERQFKDSFIEGTEIYMTPEGTLGLPVYADPLVMYWNRQIFTDVLLTEPPKYWDEFYNLASLISKKDGALNITRSAVAFGEYSNVNNAKAIISNLVLQAGSPIVSWIAGEPRSVFSSLNGRPSLPAEAAVNFYTEFSNPAKNTYSWNRSIPNSSSYFLGGDLALYFGFASEAPLIQVKNPNLNFDVTKVPTSREGGVNVSFAKFNAFAITKSTKNAAAAYGVASIFASTKGAELMSKILDLPPVRRELLRDIPDDPYLSVSYESAVRSRAWLDPKPEDTNLVFKNLIESITSGRSRTGEAVNRVNQELDRLLGN